MRFLKFFFIALWLMGGHAFAAPMEFYELLGSPAGRFLLGELGIGRQGAERWLSYGATRSNVDPAEEILLRVRRRYVGEETGKSSIFRMVSHGQARLSDAQKARLRGLLEAEARAFFDAEAVGRLGEASFSASRRSFLKNAPEQVIAKNAWLSSSRFVEVEESQVIGRLRDEAVAAARRGEKATVVFDLDETGFDNRIATAAMILGKDGWVHSAASARFPRAREALSRLKLGELRVTTEDLFAAAGISDEKAAMAAVHKHIKRWLRDPARVAIDFDAPYPGFVRYVRSLHEDGVEVVYLTGRRASEQTESTIDLLRFFGLPLDDNARLFLRPDRVKTPEYKADVVEKLEADGHRVMAVYDNEPENLVGIALKAPAARLVLFDSEFFAVPARPIEGWYRISRW